MPYSTPADSPVPFPAQGRPGHRRSFSHIAPPVSYTSTSASLSHLPRRRPLTASAPAAVNGPSSAHRKPTFQLGHDDDDDDSSADEAMTKPPTTILHDDDDRALPPLRLKVKASPFDAAVRRASPPPQASLQPPAAIPFPRSSPNVSPSASQSSLPFPQVHVRSPSDGASNPPDPRLTRPSVSRTASTPILLSNGKPLRSSLKGSSSSPNIPFPPQSLVPSIMFPDLHPHHQSYHQRARSAPSTPHLEHIDLAAPPSSPSSSSESPPLHSPSPPSSPTSYQQKNVHFPSQEEGGLATVRVFNRSAKPASLSRLGEETETETEGESSTGGWGGPRPNTWGPRSTTNRAYTRGSSYNFPVSSAGAPARHSPLGPQVEKFLDLDIANSTPIPARGAEKGNGNVYLESIGFLRSVLANTTPQRPLVLTGTMLVRNVTYHKAVAIRFTLDDWHTTNDVVARHEKSLGALPGRFVRGASGALGEPKERVCPPHAVDSVGDAAVVFGDAPAWDRFRFDIKLEDYADSLENRTMWLVARYSAGAAPGSAGQTDHATNPVPLAEWWDNNMGANYRVGFERKEQEPQRESHEQMYKRGVIVSAPSAYSPVRPRATSPPPKSYPAPPQISASISFPLSSTEEQRHQHAEQKLHQAAMTERTMARLKKLNLMNYAAPASYTAPSNNGQATRAISTSSIDSSSTSTSADSTPLQTPIQGNDESVYVQKGLGQDVDVNVLPEDSSLSGGPVRPAWGAATTPISPGMSMENGFPATFLPSASGQSTPTPMSPSELGTSPPFSSMAEMATEAMRHGGSNASGGRGHALYWPWGSFGNAASSKGAISPGEDTPTQQEKTQEELVTPPLTPPVASLLHGIKEKSTAATGPGSGTGLGQLVPPQRRKGVHTLHHPSTDLAGRATFTLGGGSPSSSGSESGSPTTRRRGVVGTASPPQSSSPPISASNLLRPGSPRPSTTAGSASPPYPGSPKRFLSPLLTTSPSFSSGTRSPSGMGVRSPLRLSPVNSSSELGSNSASPPLPSDSKVQAGGSASDLAGATSGAAGQDDAVYQAFVRQWCFAQAPGPTVGTTVGAGGASVTPPNPTVGVNV